MTRVLVVDDAPLFQAGMAAAFRDEGFEVVGQAADAMSAVSMARDHRPDLVVLDVLMPGISGLEVVDKILSAAPGCQVVLLTSSSSVEDMLDSIKSGARGYILKDTAMDELVAAVRTVVEGGAFVSPAMAGKLFDAVSQLLRHRDVVSSRKPSLTGREIEVLRYVADGLTSREIGEKLYISENTVKNHVRNILDKLGLSSRSEAVMYAVREHLIEID